MTSKMTASKMYLLIFNFLNVVETLADNLISDTYLDMTLPMFVETFHDFV